MRFVGRARKGWLDEAFLLIPAAAVLGFFSMRLPSMVSKDPNAGKPSPGPQAPPEWVAISATNLQGVYFEDKALFEQYARRRPVATIGYSIFVYHVDE